MEVPLSLREELPSLDLTPLRLEVESEQPWMGPDVLVSLWWGDEGPERFAVEFKRAPYLGGIREAVWQARERARMHGDDRRPLVVVPHLSAAALEMLRRERVSGLDLSGNGYIEVPGQWLFQREGRPNRFPTRRRSRAPYQGRSALVGRALLARPEYPSVNAVLEGVVRRGGQISIGQVSKVLSALADDLVVRKDDRGVRLLQPKKLLDALAGGYKVPKPSRSLETRVDPGPNFYERLRSRAESAGIQVVAFDPQRYVVAPQSRDHLTVYVEPGGGMDLAETFGFEPAHRFSNLSIRVVDEPGVYFDTVEEDGFRWCSPLEVYLQFMQGGKREREIVEGLGEGLLNNLNA